VLASFSFQLSPVVSVSNYPRVTAPNGVYDGLYSTMRC